jgi:hypothetical protein
MFMLKHKLKLALGRDDGTAENGDVSQIGKEKNMGPIYTPVAPLAAGRSGGLAVYSSSRLLSILYFTLLRPDLCPDRADIKSGKRGGICIDELPVWHCPHSTAF